MVKVNVKWNKEKYEVDIDPSEPVSNFKAQLYSLTMVPVERQKIMGFKGGILKDESQWKDLDLTEGKNLMLMGSAVELEKPDKPMVFLEDLPPSKAALMNSILPAGLTNLGNTCYLNATLQCLKNVPELLQIIKNYKPKTNSRYSNLLKSSQGLFNDLTRLHEPVTPMAFLSTFRMCFPRFSEKGDGGHYLQQDAEEAWGELLTAYAQELPLEGEPSGHSADLIRKSMIGKLFGIQVVEKFTCKENPEEESTSREETLLKLACNITVETSYLLDGLKKGLNEEISKSSPSLHRDAIYTKKTQIKELPKYLMVQFVRFHWKDSSKTKSKVVRIVQFPFTLDLFDLCTPEYQAELLPARKRKEDEFNASLERKRKITNEDEDDKQGEKKVAMESEPSTTSTTTTTTSSPTTTAVTAPSQPSTSDDIFNKSDQTGKYELTAVLTHQGRYAESGHYVAWVKKAEDKWYKFDDRDVTECTNEDIKKLSGGGDWHMAYLLLYSQSKN